MVADPTSALVDMLKADAALAALLDTRVFGGELPGPETKSMPRRALVVRASGGPTQTGRSFAEHDANRFDLFSYGATPREAGEVMATAALRLRRAGREVHAGVLIHSCNSAGGFASGREPDTDWPRGWQSFQLFYALENVT